jgi:predicted ester cyclase
MTTEQNKQRIAEYCNALRGTTKPMALLDQYIADSDMELKGHIQVFEAGIPCYDFIPEDTIAEGNKVMVRFRITGHHLGDLFGCPPTGNAINVAGMILYELDDDGMIINHWMEADSVGMMQQISTAVMA